MAGMNDLSRADRARMEQAERASRRRIEAGSTGESRRPQRYKLYDRIKGRVTVTMMNAIIGATVLLLVVALVVGIATGNPT